MRDEMTTPDFAAEVAAGGGLSLGQAARKFPPYRGDRPVNPSTIWRWIIDGIRRFDGKVIKLEATRVAGRWLTSQAALERFLRAQTPASETEPAPVPRTPRQRTRAADRAARELDKIGI
jgi:hypothetical protein